MVKILILFVLIVWTFLVAAPFEITNTIFAIFANSGIPKSIFVLSLIYLWTFFLCFVGQDMMLFSFDEKRKKFGTIISYGSVVICVILLIVFKLLNVV